MYLQHSAQTILNTTEKGGVRDGLKRWKAAVGSEKRLREKKRRRQECVLCTGKTDEGVVRKISTLL